MADKSKEFYMEVDSNTEETLEVVIPSGETWTVQAFSGFAIEARLTNVSLIWDYGSVNEKIIALTHGTLPTKVVEKQLVGDGIKVLALCLRNDEVDSERLGGEYVARDS